MPDTILVISNRADLHADVIIHKLQTRGTTVFRLNLDEFPKDYRVTFSHNTKAQQNVLQHLPSGQQLLTDHINAVWLRKYAPFNYLSDNLSAQERAFAQQETEHLMYGLLFSLQCFWLSHPLALRCSQWKGEQLQRAARFGFRVPHSLITNDLTALRQFHRRFNSDMVFKAMSSPTLGAQQVAAEQREYGGLPTTLIPTKAFTAGVWDDDLSALQQLPGLFQEYIEKQYELRVTVIGRQAFAAKIHSQDDPRTATDYRDFSAAIRYEKAELSEQLAQRCIQFVRSYGLEFGALDLIVTPQDDVVFLENNPGGQFYFVEQLVPELRLCDAVADLLTNPAKTHTRQSPQQPRTAHG